jgi:hypothetical protein
MVFLTVSPFPVGSLSKRRLLFFFGIVSLLCGAALMRAQYSQRPPVPLAQASVLNATEAAEIPALSQRRQ